MAKNASFVSLLFLEGPVGDFWSVFERVCFIFFPLFVVINAIINGRLSEKIHY